jgi:hypothetical protein
VLVMQYHLDRQKQALQRFKTLASSRHRAEDKILLRSMLEREKKAYKEHKKYIVEIEAHIEMLLDNYLDNERMD